MEGNSERSDASMRAPLREPSQRTRAARLGAATLLLVLGLVGAVGIAGPAPTASAAATPSAEAWQFLALTNQSRANAGLPPLQMQTTMLDIATGWTTHLVAAQALSHNPNVGAQVAGAFPDWRGWGENVGYGGSVGVIQNAFWNSPGHRENLLGDYNYVGIAAWRDGGGTLWVTVDFLKLNRAAPVVTQMSQAEATALVQASYHDFFGRAPSANELNLWVPSLVNGMDPNQFLRAVVTSPEWVSKVVVGLYQDTLGRSPDAGGLSYWTNRMRTGMTQAEVAAHFYGSAEYYSRSGGTIDSYVRALYLKLLGREPDSGGFAYWTGRLRRGESRDTIAYEFYQSVESRTRRVTALYQQLLGRGPDAAGLQYWVGRLLDGNDLNLAVALAASPEYRARALARF